ncbi:hypothetical protein GJ633_05940 [Halorubrum sp. CBA1125]|uniref:hypothetical protein n=1 Tax=Halorubrum sp. CBA1125 TaxID=2668072 RepID=UPI0012E8ABFF|nr:hypothetical protein [Halorubrum sp. CBA1125]MUW14249.1 hypothetical protein [Halorubrum sp. CBA1125]
MAKKRRRSRGDSNGLVSRRRVLAVLFAGGVGAAGVQGTGAFSTVTGDRPFSVGTAEDANALLGIEEHDPTGDDGSSVTLLTLTNRFSEPLTIDRVSVVSSGGLGIDRSDLAISQWTLQPGAESDVGAALACSTDTAADVELRIRASTTDNGESVDLTRTTAVTCQAADAQCLTGSEIELEGETVPCIDVDLQGGGEVEIEAENSVVNGDATVSLGGGGEVSVELEGTEIRGDLQIDIQGGGSVSISLANSTIDGEVRINTPGGAEVEVEMENATIGNGVVMNLGGGGEVSLSMEDGEIGDDVVIATGGGSSVDVEMEGSVIRGDLAVDARGGSSVDVETEDSEIEGERPDA